MVEHHRNTQEADQARARAAARAANVPGNRDTHDQKSTVQSGMLIVAVSAEVRQEERSPMPTYFKSNRLEPESP